MNKLEKLDLQKMIKANDVVDCTEDIRTKKHSQRIRDDVTKMIDLKKKYARLSKSNPEQFDKMCVSQCNFIFTNQSGYTLAAIECTQAHRRWRHRPTHRRLRGWKTSKINIHRWSSNEGGKNR